MTSASRPALGRFSGYCLLLLSTATGGSARSLSAQAAPRFTAEQLGCARFSVRVRTNVTTDLQGRQKLEEVRRDGSLVVQATAGAEGIAIEAWWDSLTLSRRADGATLTPDPAGMLGGRYRGILRPTGQFLRSTAPWVPDEVAEVSDLTVALDDLFPDLSLGSLRVLPDSGGAHRFRLLTTKEVDGPATADRPFAVHESESSDGVLVWGRSGLTSWVRDVTAETRVREAPGRAFRSQVVQRIELRRVGECAGR